MNKAKVKNSFGLSFFSTEYTSKLQKENGYRPPLMSIAELSEEIGISRKKIYRKIKDSTVVTESSYRNKAYYNKKDLMAWALEEFNIAKEANK